MDIWVYRCKWTYGIMCTWKNFPLIRKVVMQDYTGSKKSFEKYLKKNRKYLEAELKEWFNEFVLNYDDLTPQQKFRIKDKQFIGENKEKDCRWNRIITDSSILNFAKLKKIRVRLPWVGKHKYILVYKTVICELL